MDFPPRLKVFDIGLLRRQVELAAAHFSEPLNQFGGILARQLPGLVGQAVQAVN